MNAPAAQASAKHEPEWNRLPPEDRRVPRCYRLVLPLPSHPRREYLDYLGVRSTQRVMDPLCGTIPTPVARTKLPLPSDGIERDPMEGFATRRKPDSSVDPDAHVSQTAKIRTVPIHRLQDERIKVLRPAPLFRARNPPIATPQMSPPYRLRLPLETSISPPPRKTLLPDVVKRHRDDLCWIQRRTLAPKYPCLAGAFPTGS